MECCSKKIHDIIIAISDDNKVNHNPASGTSFLGRRISEIHVNIAPKAIIPKVSFPPNAKMTSNVGPKDSHNRVLYKNLPRAKFGGKTGEDRSLPTG